MRLDVGTGYSQVLWNGTNTGSSQFATATAGPVTVATTDNYGCDASDTLLLNVVAPPVAGLPAQTPLCVGSSVVLDAGNPGYHYQWSNGAFSQSITVLSSGLYDVTISDGICTVVDTSIVLSITPFPVDLGPDTTICQGDSLTWTLGFLYTQAFWNGSNVSTLSLGTADSGPVTVRAIG